MEIIHELTHVLTDPAHWIAEVVMDGTITLAVLYPVRLWLKRHDREKHGVDNSCSGKHKRVRYEDDIRNRVERAY